jgi:hypothetical protein
MVCTHGDHKNQFTALVTMPASGRPGSEVTVRIASLPSERISHFGLNYIHDMTTDYLLPEGATYVEGSARIVPGTGTANVTPGARVARTGRSLRVTLPAHVENGSGYTPPTVEFALRVDAPPGVALPLKFSHYEMIAHVLLLGELKTTCDPPAGPATIGVTRVVR